MNSFILDVSYILYIITTISALKVSNCTHNIAIHRENEQRHINIGTVK